MAPHDAAIARLETQVAHLIEVARKQDVVIDRMAAQLDAMQAKLDQSAGGVAVLRWLGLSSLGGAIATCAAVYAWVRG